MKRSIVLSWSGGKDSALTLQRLRNDPSFEVAALLTTLVETTGRVSAHGVRVPLVERQAQALGLPLLLAPMPVGPSNETYMQRIAEALAPVRAGGVTTIAFGDIFLADLKAWRCEQFAAIGFESIFPLWDGASVALASEFLDLGFRSVICAVDDARLDRSFVGRVYDRACIAALPAAVDPCGENGEFHSFTFDGPGFSGAVDWTLDDLEPTDGERITHC